MQPPLIVRPVHLYGHLAEGIGDTVGLAFRTPLDAIRLLEVNFPGFHKRFTDGEYYITVRRGERERDLAMDRLGIGFTGESLHIMPRAVGAGSGKGFLNVLIGGLIIGAAFFFAGPAGMAATLPGIFGATGATYGTLATMGVGLALSGIAAIITPMPKTDYKTTDPAQSFVFNGPVNVTGQGGAMPLVFGRMMVGTTVLSAALDVEMLKGEDATNGAVPNDMDVDLPRSRTKYRDIDMEDLINIPDGARITGINGGDVTGTGVREVDGVRILFDANRDGDEVLRIANNDNNGPARKAIVTVRIRTTYNNVVRVVEVVLSCYLNGFTDPPANTVNN